MKKKNVLLLMGILLLLGGCEFQPSEIYTTDVEPASQPPVLDLELNINDTNTVFFYENTQIKVRLKNTDIKLWQVDFFLDDKKLEAYQSDENFCTNINLNNTDNHVFRIDLYTSTGSNSIADKIGAEAYKFTSREWTFIYKWSINDGENGFAQITNQGALIYWKAFDGANFDKYLVTKYGTNLQLETNDTSFFDSDYFGENGFCLVYAIDQDGQKKHWATCITGYHLPKLKYAEVNKRLVVAWDKTIFHDKIKEFVIKGRDIFGSWTYFKTLDADVNYVYVDELVSLTFGQSYNFMLTTIPKIEFSQDNIGILSSFLYDNAAIPSIRINGHTESTPKGFMTQKNDSLMFYLSALDSLVLIRTGYEYYTMSPNAEYVAFWKDYQKILLYSLKTFEPIKEVDLSDALDSLALQGNFKITDNGILYMDNSPYAFIYDLINEKTIFYKNLNMQQIGVCASADAKNFIIFSTDKIFTYELVNNTLELKNTFTNGGNFEYFYNYKFIPYNHDKFYSFEHNKIFVYNLNDLKKSREIAFSGEIMNIDFTYNKVLTSTIGNFFIYSFTNGALLESVPTVFSGDTYGTILSNNILHHHSYKYYLNN